MVDGDKWYTPAMTVAGYTIKTFKEKKGPRIYLRLQISHPTIGAMDLAPEITQVILEQLSGAHWTVNP
jgi:hypothetical protein